MRRPALTPIQSSLFDAYHYDPVTSKLTLRFHSGESYVYNDVPMEKASTFAAHSSPGRYYTEHIRDNFLSAKIT